MASAAGSMCGASTGASAAAPRPRGSSGGSRCRQRSLRAWPFRHAAHAARRSAATALSRRELLGSSAAAAVLLPPLVAQGANAAGAAGGVVAASAAAGVVADVQQRELRTEVDAYGVERLALQPEGWNSWRWRGHNINWLTAGDSGPIVLLVHGFGASVYHWRYNVPQLAKHCRVYALDCLGFGWSSKPLVEYGDYSVWSDQIADFIREVIPGGERVVLVGNSLGGYNSLATAARHPELVRGVVLLNAAGRFEEPGAAEAEAAAAATEEQSLWERLVEQVSAAVKRGVVFASFVFTKQPARIRQVLNQVYVSPTHVDDDLVRSIELPARDPNAAEVFYRIITARGEAMNRLLARLGDTPLYLLWGAKDPWCVPARATQIQQYYPAAERTDLISGHCPHDDHPELVNQELLRWVAALPQESATA